MEEEYPNIEILDEQSGEWLTENANTVMTDFLTKYPEIDAVLCHNDAMAEGAAEAQAGRAQGRGRQGGAGHRSGADKALQGDPQALLPADGAAGRRPVRRLQHVAAVGGDARHTLGRQAGRVRQLRADNIRQGVTRGANRGYQSKSGPAGAAYVEPAGSVC